MSIRQLVLDENWYRPIFILQSLLQRRNLCLWYLQSRPTVPLEGGSLRQTAEACDQSTRGHRERVCAIIGALDGDRKSIRDEEQSALRLDILD